MHAWMHKHSSAASHWSPWKIKDLRCLASISEGMIKLPLVCLNSEIASSSHLFSL